MALDYLKQILEGISTLAPGGGVGGGAGVREKRQSAKELLQERIFQDRTKERDFQQNQGRLNAANQAQVQEHQSNIDLNKSKEKDLNDSRSFSQATTMGDKYAGGTWQAAPTPPPGDLSVTRPRDMSQIPEAEREFVDPNETTVQHNVSNGPDPMGRPFVNAGGQMMIPKSPDEIEQQKLASAKTADDAQQAQLKSHMDAFTSDPANAQWVKDNAEDIKTTQAQQMFGFKPNPEKLDNLAANLYKRHIAATAPGPDGKPGPGDPAALEMADHIQASKHPPKEKSADSSSLLTPEATKLYAELAFEKGGDLPSFGMGGKAEKAGIANQLAKDHAGVSLAGQKVAFEANRHSMQKLVGNYDQLNAFENVAKRNINLLTQQGEELTKMGLDSGSPLLNKPIRELDEKVFGHETVSKFRAALQIANNEVARVTALRGGSGVLSDAAREEIMKINPETATMNQILSVAKIEKQDMANSRAGYEDQIKKNAGRYGGVDTLRKLQKLDEDDPENVDDNQTGRIGVVRPTSTSGPGNIPPPPPPPPPGSQTHLKMTGKDGKVYERLYHTQNDAALIQKAKAAGAEEVK